MCEETLDLHHGKHHQAYVTALNGFVEKDASLQGKSLDDIVKLSHNKPDMAAGVQQCRPALEPHPVLAVHEPERRRHPRRAGKEDQRRISATWRSSRTRSRPAASASSAPAGCGWCSARDGKLKVTRLTERLQPAGHRRGQGAARLRRVGAQLLPGLPQSSGRTTCRTGWTSWRTTNSPKRSSSRPDRVSAAGAASCPRQGATP